MRPVPWGALALTGLALAALGGTWLSRPWAPPALQPLTQGLLGAWTLWRLGHLGWTWVARRRWHVSPLWQLATTDLPLAPTPGWQPRGLRCWLQRAGAWPHAGLFLAGGMPLPTLVANSISQDGDALLPLLALERRSAVLATCITTVPALLVGGGLLLLSG